MKIGDEVFVHGYVDEIRNDVIIIRNNGGYFGTVAGEVLLSGIERVADTPQTDCNGCEHWKYIAHEWQCETIKCQGFRPRQTDCGWK